MATGVLKKIGDAKIAKQVKQFRAAEKLSKPKKTPIKQDRSFRQKVGETQTERSARYAKLDAAIRDANKRQ